MLKIDLSSFIIEEIFRIYILAQYDLIIELCLPACQHVSIWMSFRQL